MSNALEITFRDLYATGTDTIILKGKIVDKFVKSTDKSAFLTKFETVSFEAPYVVSYRWV